ncbi:MAG: hypothetical protein WDZ30_04595 [Cellvibrionaceae bacterium]
MLIGFLLFTVFFVRAWIIWNSTPELLSESERESDDIRYRYATTLLRSGLVKLGSCLLFAAIFSFVTYSVAFLLWSSFLFAWAEGSTLVKSGLFALAAAVTLVLTYLSKPGRFFTEACLFFQRYQFFPPLPSHKEEDLMQQLERLPVGTLPIDVQNVLCAGAEPADLHRRELYDTFRKLVWVHGHLARIARQHKGVVKMFYFGREWELINNQFQVIEQQMHSNTSEADSILMQRTSNCLYYAYGLLTRYIMETSGNSREVKEKFRDFGFEVEV